MITGRQDQTTIWEVSSLPVTDLISTSDFALSDLLVRPSIGSINAKGNSFRVERKVLEMLLALKRASGRILSRDQLIAQCWGGRVVSNEAITRTLAKVRQLALLSDPPAFKIETVPKIGMRLLITQPVPVPSIADPVLMVLPFDNYGGEAARA